MCDICGDEDATCEVIGVFPPDFVAMVRNHSMCPVCEGCGIYTLAHFKNPRPCPICQGVGQMNTDLLPSQGAIAQMLMHVFPPCIAPSRPVPEGE
jgi:hypothetical protein